MKKITIIFLSIFFSCNVLAEDLKIDSRFSGAKKEQRIDVSDQKEIVKHDFDKLYSEAREYYKDAEAWKQIKCEPKSGFICTKRECNKRDIKSSLLLDKENKTITRCEENDCETFEAIFKQTGVYFNVQSEGPLGTLVRVLGNSRYKEISTVGLDAYIANGNCELVK